MIQEYLSRIDFLQLSNIVAGVIAFFVAYLKFLPLIPRSSTKIISDIDLYEKSKNSEIINSEIIKDAIEREVQRKYKTPTKIYNYVMFFISLTILVIASYFIYNQVITNKFNSTFFFLTLVAFSSLSGLIAAFDKPKIENKTKTLQRQPVFKFEIFSWSELFGGVLTIGIFGFWTFKRFFKNGEFEFDWWGFLTLIFVFTGFAIMTGAFKKEKNSDKKDGVD
tara:strand:+ start:88 stop:753 length:666 start_codon:yes stop_codon:yes gene_type:complete